MELDSRKQRILQAIVLDYVATAEPVGSQILVQRYSLGVKSATIRNEMAEMSERGYLRQPHTSAGRVPSDLGYRFYVNRLMPLPALPEAEAHNMRRALASASSELDAILRRTCQLLTAMTRLPAVATPPDAPDTELRQLFLTPIGPSKTLLVLLFSNGRTENRLLTEVRLTASEALILANALNQHFSGMNLTVLKALACERLEIPSGLGAASGSWVPLCREITNAARDLSDDNTFFVEGTQTVLDQPEFRDVERLGQVLTMLQERAALLEMFGRALDTVDTARKPVVHIRIGEEFGSPEYAEYASVTSPYFIGQRERGTIGVLGPTRMNYGRVVAAVDFMASTVSDILTRLSVAP